MTARVTMGRSASEGAVLDTGRGKFAPVESPSSRVGPTPLMNGDETGERERLGILADGSSRAPIVLRRWPNRVLLRGPGGCRGSKADVPLPSDVSTPWDPFFLAKAPILVSLSLSLISSSFLPTSEAVPEVDDDTDPAGENESSELALDRDMNRDGVDRPLVWTAVYVTSDAIGDVGSARGSTG